MAKTLVIEIDAAIVRANRNADALDLSGEGERSEAYDVLLDVLKSGLQQVEILRGHRHQWDAYHYCTICRADGAA